MANIVPVNLDMITAEYGTTEAGYRLLSIMIDPISRSMSVKDICAMAEISTPTYYTLFKDQRFIDAYYQACKVACITAAMPVMHSIANQAINGDMVAAKMIMDMTGLHQPNQQTVKHEHDIGPNLLQLYKERG